VSSALLIVAGLAGLRIGADLLVRGGAALASQLGVRPIVIGLTVVALGTSLPELAIGIDAVRQGSPGLAVGNIVGTNLVNILFILGLSALILPIAFERRTLRFDLREVIAADLLVLAVVARISDTARRRVLEQQWRQVADRDDAHEIVALDHGQMAKAAVEHQDGRVLGRVVGANGLRMRRHAVGDARGVGETTRDGAQDVALGQDPGQPAIGQHEDRADVAVDHPLGDFHDRHAGLDGQQVARHVMTNRGHGGTVRNPAPGTDRPSPNRDGVPAPATSKAIVPRPAGCAAGPSISWRLWP
jgi:hypothetical protein